MKSTKERMFAASIIAGLAVIGSVMNSHQSTLQGAGGPTVTIDQAQLPLPVQGSLGVSGTVAATQSGNWNVGITGTPNVKVTNAATAPVLFVNVNDPGRIPYQSRLEQGGVNDQFTFPQVPGGHRLVIQHVSVRAIVNPPSTEVFVQVMSSQPIVANIFISFFPVAVMPFSGTFSPALAVADQPVLGYIEAGFSPIVNVILSPPNNPNFTDVILTGYMEDCTIAPCAAIAQ
jgi:hypothetical protein